MGVGDRVKHNGHGKGTIISMNSTTVGFYPAQPLSIHS